MVPDSLLSSVRRKRIHKIDDSVPSQWPVSLLSFWWNLTNLELLERQPNLFIQSKLVRRMTFHVFTVGSSSPTWNRQFLYFVVIITHFVERQTDGLNKFCNTSNDLFEITRQIMFGTLFPLFTRLFLCHQCSSIKYTVAVKDTCILFLTIDFGFFLQLNEWDIIVLRFVPRSVPLVANYFFNKYFLHRSTAYLTLAVFIRGQVPFSQLYFSSEKEQTSRDVELLHGHINLYTYNCILRLIRDVPFVQWAAVKT